MKKSLAFICAALLALGLSACGGAPAAQSPTPTPKDTPTPSALTPAAKSVPTPVENSKYTFVYQDCKLPMNAEFAELLAYLGEPESYFEAESCAFQGLDKTYTFPGVELITYPIDGVDYISNIVFADDSVATPEGITLGATLEDIVATYGEDYLENFGQYRYVEEDTMLCFLLEDGVVVAVEYVALNDQLT